MRLILITGFIILLPFFNGHLPAADMTDIFPPMEGFNPKGKVDTYTPDNLFEYINGAADVFLSYDFVKLATLSFENKDKQSFTVDVYRHSSNRNGFGIYSQEKPRKGPFLSIGAQGYYEKGVLNFLRGQYYVKMSGYDLGEKDKDVLTTYANLLANKLDGPKEFPGAVKSFPTNRRIEFSEGYIAKNFLGHSFLHSAYISDYEIKDQKIQVFIMVADDQKGVKEMLNKYLAFAKKKGKEVEVKEGIHRFEDPYYRRSGKMNLKLDGNYLYGLFCKNDAVAESLIKETGANLKKLGLIK
jgi:hypothetical protein